MKKFIYRSGEFDLNSIKLMGIVNITPDSFSDGGKWLQKDEAVKHSIELINDGADIIDLGACSTKPFSSPVSFEEEQQRLLPVLTELKSKTDIPVSVDTFYPETVEAALLNGADIINDVGGVYCEKTAELVKKYNAGYIVMHAGVKLSPPHTENSYPAGVVNDVRIFFDEITDKLYSAGLSPEQICLDPGFGFMKNTSQNVELLRNLSLLNVDENALLVGVSRKRFIGELTEKDNPEDRIFGSLAADIYAAVNGADIIRTHEIKIHREAFNLIDKVK